MAGASSPEPVRPLRFLVIVVALVVTLAAIGVSWWAYNQVERPTSSVRDDGPTLYSAYAAINASVHEVTGGPWALFWGTGIAAQAAFSPNIFQNILTQSVVVNDCGKLLNGLTMWNGTIPVFAGTLNSGTATFWQFGFYSSTTNQILLASDVMGEVTVFPPEQNAYLSTNCMPWGNLGNQFPSLSNWARDLYTTSGNSPAEAELATETVGQETLNSQGPWAEIYWIGPNMFYPWPTTAPSVPVSVTFDRCGLDGITGIQPLDFVGNNSALAMIGETNCALLNYAPNPVGTYSGYYQFVFSKPSSATELGTTQMTLPYQVGSVYNISKNFTNTWGLANWMTGWSLSLPVGKNLPMTSPTCLAWVASVSQCSANTSGWFFVITSPNGSWINSYGVMPGSSVGWSQPVTAMVTDQQLVLVVPSSWNVTGDVLSVSSKVSTSTVVGSDTL